MQADARDGIWLDTPEGHKKTYLFLWIDDFSRKILFGKYCFDEKLTALLDSFRYCLLRYGIPLRVYVDNGQVYVSRHLIAILVELHIKHIRHPPYQAYCKGKIEAANKIIKNQFQREAQVAGIRTLDELNSAFWAWMDLDYNTRILAATGQSPDARFGDGCRPISAASPISTLSTRCSCGANAAPSASTAGSSCTASSPSPRLRSPQSRTLRRWPPITPPAQTPNRRPQLIAPPAMPATSTLPWVARRATSSAARLPAPAC